MGWGSQQLFGFSKVLTEEFDQIFYYGFKDICDLDDFNQVVDWDNSSSYQKTN
tara:strand:+ start:943 stop:1101 length:159 start_codon:yes stop_codon:yes gene_type:complete